MPGDQPAMPGKDRGRTDQPVRLQLPGEEPDQGAEGGEVIVQGLAPVADAFEIVEAMSAAEQSGRVSRFFEPAPGRNWFIGASIDVVI